MGINSFEIPRVPDFCRGCGSAYPWMLRKIAVLETLASEIDGLDPEDRRIWREDLLDLIKDTPRTPLAANRFLKVIRKLGPTIGDGAKTIIIQVISEAAKKIMFPVG